MEGLGRGVKVQGVPPDPYQLPGGVKVQLDFSRGIPWGRDNYGTLKLTCYASICILSR